MFTVSGIYKTQQGTYKVQWRDKTGRLVSRTFKRRGDAVAYRDNDLDKTLDVSMGRRKVKWWGQRWEQALTVRENTRRGYLSKRDLHVVPLLGDVEMGEMDRQRCKEFVAELVAKGCAPSTIRQTVAVLSGICQTACDAGVLKANPALRLGAPSPRPPEMRFLSRQEVLTLAGAGDWQTSLIIRFAAWTGLRASELWGLQVGDVDLERCQVTVERTWSHEVKYDTTKTNRVRRVRYPSVLTDDLKTQGGGRRGGAPFFTAPEGGPVDHDNFWHRRFTPTLERSGIGELRFHDLRHTYASLLIHRGMDATSIMKRMGHSTVTLTVNTYGHLFPDADVEMVEWLGEG